MRSKYRMRRKNPIITIGLLGLFLLLAVFIRRHKKVLLLIIVVLALLSVPILKWMSPDGFADRIQSLSPNYYNTIGAPARTWPKYEEEQRYNIRALSNTGIVASDTEIPVITGPHGLRLNTLVGKLGQ